MVLVPFADLRYMKGRVTYDQINAALKSINTAAKAKYRILRQPLKSLNNHSRKLQARFKEQETKDTKGTSDSCLRLGGDGDGGGARERGSRLLSAGVSFRAVFRGGGRPP